MNHNYTGPFNAKHPIMRFFLVMFTCLFLSQVSQAQLVTQNESFETGPLGGTAIFPPAGWKQEKTLTNVSGAFSHQSYAGAINPTPGAAPLGGSSCMMFNSDVANVNDTSILISKPYDFSNAGAATPTMSFFMYRDNGFAGNVDKVEVFINTSPTLTGATPLNHNFASNTIPRPNTVAPTATANTWNQYTFNIPASPALKRYFIIRAISQGGRNIYIDRFTVQTYPSPTSSTDVSFDLTYQNLASVGQNQVDQWVVGVRCVVANSSGCGNINIPGSALKLDSLLFNTNGTTNVNDIQNAKVYYTGGYNQFSRDYVSPFMPAVPGIPVGTTYPVNRYAQVINPIATNLDFRPSGGVTPCFYLEYDTTYFWLTYDIKPAAVGGNFIDADFRGATVSKSAVCPSNAGDSAYVAIDPTTFVIPGAAQIDLPYCIPVMTTGTAWAGYTNNDYIHSTELFGDIPTVINTGVQTLSLQPTTAPAYPNAHFVKHPPDYELMANVPGRTVILTQGQNYNLKVQVGTWGSNNHIAAWIDFNRDGVFNNVPFPNPGWERIGMTTGSGLNSLGFVTWNFTVPSPSTAPPSVFPHYTGPTRMRVREVFANTPINPCQTYTFGETEDYTITILPDCPVGYKLWLGNTDDWSLQSNWCGGVPTLNDDAVINRAAPAINPSRPYFKPVIRSGVAATTKNLTISASDTVFINSPDPIVTSLKMKGELLLNGGLVVQGSFNPELSYGTGTLVNNIMTPFKAQSTDARTQIIYTATELSAQGLQANDQIIALKYFVTKSSTSPFNNFSITWGHTAQSAFATPTPIATPFTALNTGPLTTANGAYTITLDNPIVWDGVNNIVLQYCFDNASANGANDDRLPITQTTGRASTLILNSINNGNNGAAGQGTSGCGFTAPNGTFIQANGGFFGPLSSYRPNVTFVINRPYGKAKITAQNNWTNNGVFVQGNSVVMFDTTVAQNIQGLNNTTFSDLQINKSSANDYTQLMRPVFVDSVLTLTQGQLRLNKNDITLNYSAQNAITRTNGFIISEDTLSRVNWNLSNVVGYRRIPFGHSTTGPVLIPFSLNQTAGAGNIGTVTVSTYNAPANLPMPPTVNHLNLINTTTNNAANTVDRFWTLKKDGPSGITDIIFTYHASEKPVTAGWQGRAYPWFTYTNSTGPKGAWLRTFSIPVPPQPAPPVTYVPSYWAAAGVDSVRIAGYTYPSNLSWVIPAPGASNVGPGNSSPWAIAGHTVNTALPVDFIDFQAEVMGDRVRLFWTTANEVDNDYFTIDRSRNADYDFSYLTKVNSYFGTSTQTLKYETYDYAPLKGLQYYKLSQTDLNGERTEYKTIPVYFGEKLPFNITSVITEGMADGIKIEFEYDSELPVTYTITDMTGKLITHKADVPAVPGTNQIELSQSLARGVYFVIIQNNVQAVSRKFVY